MIQLAVLSIGNYKIFGAFLIKLNICFKKYGFFRIIRINEIPKPENFRDNPDTGIIVFSSK